MNEVKFPPFPPTDHREAFNKINLALVEESEQRHNKILKSLFNNVSLPVPSRFKINIEPVVDAIRSFGTSMETLFPMKVVPVRKRLTNTRIQAKESGAHKYFTGKRCKRGHIADRLVSTGHCIICKQHESFKRKYGITLLEYNQLSRKQRGLCRICEKHCPTSKRLAVDHCHKTGEVRGLLCQQCNTALGKFKDSPMLLLKAAVYLEESRMTEASPAK